MPLDERAGELDDRSDNTSAWAIVWYLRNGRLDRSFGRRGIVIGDFGTGRDWASSLELQPDGKLLVSGSIYKTKSSRACAPGERYGAGDARANRSGG
jgi:hypothetical protein